MIRLDERDHRIIKELRTDSRASVREIAKKTSIRPSTVHQRIQRLRRHKIIERFTLKLNNEAVGENFIVFMLITTDKDLDNRVFTKSHIKEAFGITGEYDLMLKLKFKDVVQFNEFVIKFRKEQPVVRTLTLVVTTTIKEEL